MVDLLISYTAEGRREVKKGRERRGKKKERGKEGMEGRGKERRGEGG